MTMMAEKDIKLKDEFLPAPRRSRSLLAPPRLDQPRSSWSPPLSEKIDRELILVWFIRDDYHPVYLLCRQR